MALDNHAFCSFGVASSDLEEAGSFYEAILGWKAAEHSFPNGETSTLFFASDFPRAHLRPCNEGEPSQWIPFLRVLDVDASTELSTANGGGTLVPPTDIAPGRFSVVTAPSGATIALYHEANEEAAEHAPPGPGNVHWTELHSGDIEADLPWLKATFAYEAMEMPIPAGGTYYILQSGGKPRGGAVTCMVPGATSTWLSWVHVEDTDAGAAAVQERGGKTLSDPSDYPGVGRMAMVSGPDGAVFGLITPTTP